MADYITTFDRLYFLKNKERQKKYNFGARVFESFESSGICKYLYKIYSLFHIYIMLHIHITRV